MIGKTLGNFTCTALIGKGGMGEVYQAKDQKLGRDVAIKVLPEEFARDSDRVARFQREAKLLASLNHPNIAAIYGLEEAEDTHFLVLELVEGQTLADRIKGGPVPVEESLKLALQIAEALEAAHEKGVIHRDLKPANIKVTPDGKVKVLDFGLAKAFAGEQTDMNLSNSPTLSDLATQQGLILGTAAYMSPEQARGKPVDKRTDVWAFGCVLYEMLTGQAAFQGEDVTEILAAVVKSEVNLGLLPAKIHTRINELLSRCLKKEQKKRYRDIGDARYEIEQALIDPSELFCRPVAITEPRIKARQILLWASITLILTIITGTVAWNIKTPESHRVIRFSYELPENQFFSYPYHQSLAVSPDGTQLVYSTPEGLYLRNENELVAKFIFGTNETPTTPFFSPDGQWIGYFSRTNQKLKKIDIRGGVPVALCDVPEFTGASWGADDMIAYGEYSGPIYRIPAKGGNPETLVEDENILAHPQILPDGKTVMFTLWKGNSKQVAVKSIETGERKVLFLGHSARYLPTGHVVYAVENNLVAVPFDLNSLKTLSGPISIVEGVTLNPDGTSMNYAVSESGTLAYIPESASGWTKSTLVWVDRSGAENPISAAPPRPYAYPRISPDGKRVALDVRDQDIDIWIWDFARELPIRFTSNVAPDYYPVWTPDGKFIAFESTRAGGVGRIYKKASNNPTGAVEPLTENINVSTAINGYFFTPDNEYLVFREQHSVEKGDNIGMISLKDNSDVKWLLETEDNERNAELHPDGEWIAYQSDRSGNYEIYVRPFPNVDDSEFQISNAGGECPLWSRNGDELFYIEPGNPAHMVTVSIVFDPKFNFGTPERLFDWQYMYNAQYQGRMYDVSRDAKHFLMIKQGQFSPQIIIVTNWFEELKEKVPVP